MRAVSGIRLAILIGGLLVCSLFAVGIGAAEGGQSLTAQAQTDGDIETESFQADRTIFIIEVRENGSAGWRFRYEQRLETDADIADFKTYAERFNSEETTNFRNFRERARALTESGSNAIDRGMAANQFQKKARIEERPPAGDEFGVIEMSFVWTGFAETNDDRVVVGDVFIGGLYVGPDQQLRFERGPNLQFDSTAPDPDATAAETLSESESIMWRGEETFADRHPRVVFTRRPADTEPSVSGTETQGDEPEDTGGSIVPLLAVVIVILLGSSAAFVYRAGLFATGRVGEERASKVTRRGTSESEPGDLAEVGSTRVTAAERGLSKTRDPRAITDEELHSDEKRVIDLLKAQGGRMKQADIVDRTDWSKSKVSMVLSDMESEETISKLRVGRENIVSLAGQEPDAAGSPFDEE